jgi:hypothetical protein
MTISSQNKITFTDQSKNLYPLLGAPLFPGTALDRAWTERLSELSRIISRLGLVGAQDALIPLRGSFGAPKVQHLLRCSPSFESDGPSAFDKLM